MSSVQHKPFDFIGIPTDLSIALIGIPPSKDAETAKFAASRFQKIADDYQAWELAARKLHVEVDDSALDGSAVDVSASGAKSSQGATSSKLTVCQEAIETHYAELNDAFLYKVHLAIREAEGMEDCDQEGLNQLSEAIPKEIDRGFLSHAKYNEILREFIRTHKNSELLSLVLFESTDRSELLEMLIEEGVEPEELKELPGGMRCDNKKAFAWTSLLCSKVDCLIDLDYCKLVLKKHPIDEQGLTYLLWLLCHAEMDDTEDKQIEVMEFLLKEGAQWDLGLISDYPAVVITQEPLPLSFVDEHLKTKKKKMLAFLASKGQV